MNKMNTTQGSQLQNDGQIAVSELDPQRPVNRQAENLPYDRTCEIQKESLTVSEDLLGKGQFGKVFKGSIMSPITKTIVPVAVKIGFNPNDQKMLFVELKIMIHIGSHPNVLSLVGAVTKSMVNGELYVITEFCTWGDLEVYIRKRRNAFLDEIVRPEHEVDVNFTYYTESAKKMQIDDGSSNASLYMSENDPNWAQKQQENRTPNVLTTSDILSYCYQAAKGMNYLVQKNVLHRDLAARNLLLMENQVVKVSDFGLARQEQVYEMKTNIPMPVKWMALESLKSIKTFTPASDVWSFGVVLWELFSFGATPYPRIDNRDLEAHLERGLRLEKPLFAPTQIYQLMHQTWLRDPLKRPAFADICERIGKELERCSKPLYEEINHKLAEEEEQRLHYYVNWRKSETTEPPAPTNPDSRTLNYGMRGEDVKEVQMTVSVGYPPDGGFGRDTKRSVVEYQRRNGLDQDGIVGYKTWAMIRGTGVGHVVSEEEFMKKYAGTAVGYENHYKGTCLAGVQTMFWDYGIPLGLKDSWKKGIRVKGNNIPTGTAIAAFEDNGKYSLHSAAIFIREMADGLQVWNQDKDANLLWEIRMVKFDDKDKCFKTGFNHFNKELKLINFETFIFIEYVTTKLQSIKFDDTLSRCQNGNCLHVIEKK